MEPIIQGTPVYPSSSLNISKALSFLFHLSTFTVFLVEFFKSKFQVS